MPNTGKPSQDCHLCRRRRVKCDLTRPGCNRCVKYGVECPGYRNQQELVFRNSTPSGSKKNQKPKKESPAANGTSDSGPGPSHQSSISITADSPVTVDDIVQRFTGDATVPRAWLQPAEFRTVMPRSLNQHWTQQSVSILLNVYSTIDFVHSTYRRYDRDGPLLWAAHLFSRTYVTNLRQPTALYSESADENKKILGIYMSRTLNAVSHALSSPQGALRDDVLATVWILANYEILAGSLDRKEPLSPWHLHAKGLYSILKTRGAESFMTEQGRTAFWPTFNMIQIQCLVSNARPPPETEEWLQVVRHHMNEDEGLALHIARFIAKVCTFQSRAMPLVRNKEFEGVAEYYQEAWTLMTAAENELDAWTDHQPAFSHELDPYMRNMQYSATIKGFNVLQMMGNMLTHYPQSPVPLQDVVAHRKYCLQSIRVSAQSIISNIPYAIGPMAKGRDKSPRVLFDALKLVWPLTSIYITKTTLPEQQRAAGMTLQFMSRELGVRQASRSHSNMTALAPEAEAPLEVGDAGLPWVAAPVDVAPLNVCGLKQGN